MATSGRYEDEDEFCTGRKEKGEDAYQTADENEDEDVYKFLCTYV